MSGTNEALVKEPLHLALKFGDTCRGICPVANKVYNLGINPDEFEDRRAFQDKDGLFTLHYVKVADGSLTWVFKDRFSGDRDNEESAILDNPKDFLFKDVVKNFAITINTTAELDFLKGLKQDVRYDSARMGNTLSYSLMVLLNAYGVGSGWTANPVNGQTTAYFIPRYFGPGQDAPEIYNFNPHAKLLVVVDLLVYGDYKTHALMVG